MRHCYTGIGSRQTPADVLVLMRSVAYALDLRGYTLRSGGATGADTAFAQGATRREIYLPWVGFNNVGEGIVARACWVEAEALAATIHPHWARLSQGVRKLHTRNMFQVLGAQLIQPSQFVVYWAPTQGGEVLGGTRTAVVLAQQRAIPCFNLADMPTRRRLERFIAAA